jgi:hypothetical protein
MLITLAGLVSILAAGVPAVLAVSRDVRPRTLLGLGFLYGCGIVHFVLLALSLARVPWSLAFVLPGVALTSIGLWLIARRRTRRAQPADGVARDAVAIAIDIVSIAAIALYGWFTAAARVWQWDFWAIWGLKARVFAEARGIDWSFLTRDANAFSHPDYPLLVTLQYNYLALLSGAWSDRWMGLVTAAFAGALLLVLRDALESVAGARVSAAITFIATAFVVTPFVGLADGPLVAYVTAALVFLYLGRTGRPDAMRHAALLLGLGALTKNEGLAWLASAAVALVVVGRLRDLTRLWPALALVAPWLVIRAVYGLETDVTSGPLLERFTGHLAEGAVLLRYLGLRVAEPWIVVAMLVAIVAAGAALRRYAVIFAAVVVQFAIYVAAYMVSPHPVAWHVSTSWPRISTHLLLPLLIAVTLALAARFEVAEDAPHAEAGRNV